MHVFLQRFFLTALLVAGHIAMAQVKFSATVSSTQISKNEIVQLRLMVENAKEVQQITPPEFKNFVLVSGPNQESGMTSINGDVKQYIALSYLLKPKRPGNFTIAPAYAKADGKEYRSNTVRVEVSSKLAPDNTAGNNSPSPFGGFSPFEDAVPQTRFNDYILKKGENATEKINRNMFVKLELDKTTCYVGEPIIATYKLYTRLKSVSNLTKNPSLNGFSVIDLQPPGNMNYTIEKLNGREYNVYLIRRAQLYPLQPGSLELESVEIENNVQFIKEEYANRNNDLLNDVFSEFAEATIPAEGIEIQKVTLKSKPVSITVKALPEANVPAMFKGAVGNFSITAALEKNNFTTDDAGKLKLIITGVGNLQLVNTPDIDWPQGFDSFEPTTTDDYIKTTVPVSGQKIVIYPFTISVPGNYVIPAIKFSYFNAKEGKYKTDSTQPISFTVNKGTGKKNIDTLITKKRNDSLWNKFFSNRRWVVSSIAIVILCGLIFWLKRDKKKEAAKIAIAAKAAEEKAAEQQFIAAVAAEEKNYLERAAELLAGDSTAFYNELNHGLKSYLSKKLNLPIETINKRSITEQLDKKNISINTSIQLQQVMNGIELQLYTPFAETDKMQELYNSTAAIIQLLDTYKG